MMTMNDDDDEVSCSMYFQLIVKFYRSTHFPRTEHAQKLTDHKIQNWKMADRKIRDTRSATSL